MKYLLVCLLFFPILGSCGLPGPKYDLVCINLGNSPLNDVRVKYNDHTFRIGYLSPKMPATHNSADERAPIPENAEATWVTETDQKSHKALILVKSSISPSSERGCLIVWFDNAKAGVTWRTKEQWSQMVWKDLKPGSL